MIAIYHSKSKTEALQCGSFIGGGFSEDGIDTSKSYPMITDVFKYLPSFLSSTVNTIFPQHKLLNIFFPFLFLLKL